MRDDYPSSPSTSSSSPRHSILASLPHLHNCHASSNRASEASDIAHLLDPSYSPTRAQHDRDTHIYIDHTGEAHDPDYRLFAIAPSRASPKLRFTRHVYDADDDVGEDEDELDTDEPVSLYSRRTSFDSYHPRSTSSRGNSPADSSSLYDTGYSYEPYTFSSPDIFEEDFSAPPRESNKLRRRHASPEDTDDGSSPTAASPNPDKKQVIRRQWQAFRLRTQVAAYRARRRVENAIASKAG